MGTKSEVAELLPEITPFTLPDDPAGQNLYDMATARVSADAPGLPAPSMMLAQTYYIAHLLCGKTDGYGITSERLGQHAITKATGGAGSSDWLTMYQQIVRAFRRSAITTSIEGVIHDDTRIADSMNLDASGGWP